MATLNQDPPSQQTIAVSPAPISLETGSTEGTIRINYARFQQDGIGPTFFMDVELRGSATPPVVPTTGQIWPRGLN